MAVEAAVLSVEVVVDEPGAERLASFVAVAIHAAVGLLAKRCLDEPLRFPVRPRSIWPWAEVAHAETTAGERVDRRAVGGAVVGHHSLKPR